MLLAYLSGIKFKCMQIVPVGNKQRLFFEIDRESPLTVTLKVFFHPFILQRMPKKKRKRKELKSGD